MMQQIQIMFTRKRYEDVSELTAGNYFLKLDLYELISSKLERFERDSTCFFKKCKFFFKEVNFFYSFRTISFETYQFPKK